MRRGIPSVRRLLLEYAIVFVIIWGVALLAGLIPGLVAGVVAMLLLRMTRPKASDGGRRPSKDAPSPTPPPEKT